ncbi:protein-S-isoprenylcysteine O-methyltransferase-like [Liolophura sinensis]|uniref:protein-S-isoprenylcysteine O-methyltransferase-like n=1 Tax=Liolophura sinensis TaxID=3198878 RepID=UPI00315923DB
MANGLLVLNPESRCSLWSFLSGSAVCAVPLVSGLSSDLSVLWKDYWKQIIVCYGVVQNASLFAVYCRRGKLYQVAVRAGGLGLTFGLGILVSLSNTTFINFGWYITMLSFFHWSEYFVTAISNPKTLSVESFLLNHSLEYKLAAMASWVEYWVEWYFVPGLKTFRYVSLVGLALVIGGELMRKAGMLTAKTNFNHYVQRYKKDGHELVTRGVYNFVRHPAYVGWFYWSIGTQLVLINPLCLPGYAVASWRFFRERIQEEEIYLLNFFGEDYVCYQKKTGTGLPFIHGYRGEL